MTERKKVGHHPELEGLMRPITRDSFVIATGAIATCAHMLGTFDWEEFLQHARHPEDSLVPRMDLSDFRGDMPDKDWAELLELCELARDYVDKYYQLKDQFLKRQGL